MAAGINFNGLWAAAGKPVNVVRLHEKQHDGGPFHIGGSDAAGIVYQVGAAVVDRRVGDEVVVHAGWWDATADEILAGADPMLTPGAKMWGYEVNYGGFAQFTRVKAHQLVAKPPHLSWEEAAAFMVNGAASYRALHGFSEHAIREGQVALVWGGAGGLGCQAIQICKVAGAIPVAVVSDDDKFEFCLSLGAKGVVNRSRFDHWGMLPHWDDSTAYARWLDGARAFGEAIWDTIGTRQNPHVVFEHPGEATLPTSCYVCDTGGMVVICAGTSGYNATLDLRYHWMRQKRLQGTHYANNDQVRAINDLVHQKKVSPCLSRTFSFEEIPLAHHLMGGPQQPYGNTAALVTAPHAGLGRRS
jgi:crotonyl-CoA carboxylase/reductase